MNGVRRILFAPALCVLLLTGCGPGASGTGGTEGQADKVKDQPAGPNDKAKPAPATKVTKENYDKIQVGMTRREVEKILGPGMHQTEPHPPGDNSVKYIWQVPGHNTQQIQIIFTDDKVSLTYQNGLN
jgi:hypothetical protein